MITNTDRAIWIATRQAINAENAAARKLASEAMIERERQANADLMAELRGA